MWSVVPVLAGQAEQVDPAVAAIVFPEQAMQLAPAASDVVPAGQLTS
jgi:hypothetical protein